MADVGKCFNKYLWIVTKRTYMCTIENDFSLLFSSEVVLLEGQCSLKTFFLISRDAFFESYIALNFEMKR